MSTLGIEHLREYFEARLSRTRDGTFHPPEKLKPTIAALLRGALQRTERVLREMIGPYHFELSVFAHKKQPRIVAYYDSASHEQARSAAEWTRNRNYYRQRGYAVVELLDNPTADLRIIPDTLRADYRHASDEQRKNIRSTVLYCFDVNRPAALVATCDRPRAFRRGYGSLEALLRTLGCAIAADLELEDKLLPRGQPTARDMKPTAIAYSWIHISDVHFGAPPASHRFDQKIVCDALVEDISGENRPWRPDVVLITGDIAFQAKKGEYRDAVAWLRRVANAAGVRKDQVFLVPGNHDIDRGVADGTQLNHHHEAVRRQPSELDNCLDNPKVRAIMLRKLSAFQGFVGKNFPKHPRNSHGTCVDWVKHDKCDILGKKLKIRLVGLSTVWVSDSLDGKGAKDSRVFLPNMVIGQAQLHATLSNMADDEFAIVLSHHPAEWLATDCRALLQRYLAGSRYIYLCGHVHRKEAGLFRRMGGGGTFRWYIAGATHDEDVPGYRGEHGYAWGALRLHEGRWEAGWSPRVYVADMNKFRLDRTKHDLDEYGFTWETLRESVEGPTVQRGRRSQRGERFVTGIL